MARCEFWFDFSSPFAYLAATQVERFTEGHELVYRPFLLGGLFKLIGTPIVPLATFPENKMRLALKDQYRWADFWGVPFKFPSIFPQMTVLPLRVVLQLAGSDQKRAVRAFFDEVWVRDGNVQSEETVRRILGELGLDADGLLRGAQDPKIKDALKRNTDEAAGRGLCGAPSFVVGDEVYWGQDRLDMVKRALGGWKPVYPELDTERLKATGA
jgi:2-hydroxychromene-2-carboxylate isomerase